MRIKIQRKLGQKKGIIIGGSMIMAMLLVLAGCTSKVGEQMEHRDITVFKSQSCGCCTVYAQYLEGQGMNVNVEMVADLAPLKEELGVPKNMQSCHTSKIGDYYVEGHVPLEAVKKLMDETPDIKGIAMPGMPSGSPGMPGSKNGPFVVHAVNHDGTTYEFMRI